METASLFLEGTSAAQVVDALATHALLDGPSQEGAHGFAYFRLVPPDRAPFREALAALTGALEPAPGDLWVTHPFECWLKDAQAPSGPHRPHALLPVDVLEGPESAPVAALLRPGVDVRTLPANAAYLVLALAHAGFARPALRVLD